MNCIKKQNANGLVNWALYEAAQIVVMHNPTMVVIYYAVERRHADKHQLPV